MTKKELHSLFPKLVETGQSPEFRAMLEAARHDRPRGQRGDATAIINNEGYMRGWDEALDYLETVWKTESEKPKPAATGLYQDPDPRKQPLKSDQNRL